MRGVEQIPWLYDAVLSLSEHAGLDRWRAWLVRGARGRSLDLGCGTGRNLPLYPRESLVVGVDPGREVLRAAQRRMPKVPLVRARAEALPFKEGAFDTVVSGFCFCSVGDPHRGLTEIRRVLAPGGRLRMLEHVRGGRVRGRVQDLVQPAWTWVTGGCRNNRDTERVVRESGFTIHPETHRAEGTLRRFAASPEPESDRATAPPPFSG